MSVLFLPPSAGAASVPDATETTAGKIRIATSAEATAGTNDLTSMTPLKVKSVVDAAVVGGVTYQGTFDASSPADLSNASKGDLYIISVAGSYQGQDWAVGDHLLINADMGGTLDPNKIDKVDNTDSVTSVAGRTGAVVLSASDVSGLATVATSGAYSDLTGTPTLGTAAAEDVGTGAGNVVQLNGSAQLPAVDGSLLTNISATVAALDDVGDVTITTPANTQVIKYNSTSGDWENGAVAYADVSGTPTLATVATTGAYSDLTGTPSLATVATTGAYSDLSGTPDVPDFQTITVGSNTTLSSSLEDGCYLIMFTATATATIPAYPTGKSLVFRFVNFGAGTCTIQQASGGTRLYEFGNSGITGVNSVTVDSGVTRTFHLWAAGSSVGLNYWSEASPSSTSATVAALDDIGDVDTTGVSTNNVLKYDGANWVDGSVAYSEVTGKPSFATIATTGDYSDLNDSVVLQQFNATATASAISSNALHVFRLYGTGGFTLTLSTSTVINGFALFNNVSGSDVTITGGQFRSNGEYATGSSSIIVKSGERRLYYLENLATYMEVNSTLIGHNADVTITSPSNGEALIYNSTSGDWENGTVSATVAALNDIGDVSAAAPNNGEALIYNSTSGDWENGTVSATVAALNDIGDVSAAAPNNGDVIAYNSTSGDWEPVAQGISAMNVTVSAPSTDQTLGTPSGVEEAYIYTPSANITVNLAAAATAGSGFRYQIKNRSTNTITIDANGSETIDGSTTFALAIQDASVTLITDGSNWFII